MKKHKKDIGEKAENTRHEILESATELFTKHGVNEVSLYRVMANIGMTPGGFYKYFNSKEALAGEVCSKAFEQMYEVWRTTIDQARQQSQPALYSLVTKYLAVAKEGNCPIIAFEHDAAGMPHDRSFSKAYRHGSKALLNTLIDISQVQGTSAGREQSLIFFAAMLGVGLLSQAVGGEEWVREIKAALLSQLNK